MSAPTVALIVAAGRGRRLGGETPKQYLPLAGRAVLHHAARAFRAHPRVDAVRVVIHPDDRALHDAAVAGLDLLAPVAGGAERQDSVRLGLESFAAMTPERVLIHDGARPLVAADAIDRVLDALDQTPGAILARPVTDTLKRARAGDIGPVIAPVIEGTLARDGLWRAETPQGFRFAPILDAHRRLAGRALGDDAAVAEAAGLEVALVPGRAENPKITTAADLALVRRLLDAEMETRVGNGFDVHRFGPGDHVRLCGLAIAHDHGLVGHSDADVALHALTDALLGALGAGDIGQHFPPGEPRWRGMDSAHFLAHAAALVRAAGGTIGHVDLTIVCERPKVGPHRAAMVTRVAAILGVAPGRVSVKATTTEGLGFTGRREGIAAQATATIRLPVATGGDDIVLEGRP